MKAARTMALALTCLGMLIVFMQSAAAQEPLAGRIVFVCGSEGHFEEADICAMNADGSDRVNLTDSPGYDGDPRWTPDGEHIAFVSGRDTGESFTIGAALDLYVMDADGDNVRLVVEGATYEEHRVRGYESAILGPAWTPDGEQIVYSVECAQFTYCGPYVVKADGSDAHLLTTEIHSIYTPAEYARDGREILLSMMPKPGSSAFELFRLSADGSVLETLTSTPYEDEFYPALSPDGSQIAYLLRDSGIYLMNPDGSDPRPMITPGALLGFTHVRWAPDGESLLFTAQDDLGVESLYVAEADGTNVRLLPGAQPGDCCGDWRAGQP